MSEFGFELKSSESKGSFNCTILLLTAILDDIWNKLIKNLLFKRSMEWQTHMHTCTKELKNKPI